MASMASRSGSIGVVLALAMSSAGKRTATPRHVGGTPDVYPFPTATHFQLRRRVHPVTLWRCGLMLCRVVGFGGGVSDGSVIG